jgi:hypothetical protein
LASCLIAGALGLPINEARADSPVQRISSSLAQGLTGELPTITVWAGAGANLNLIPTGEIIKKVWLDDPSQITLDFDGPMCMLVGNLGGSSCEDSAATVIHLRRIQRLKFPNLPRTKSTLLSVITRTSSGERKLYQFRVAYGSGVPQYHTVSIYPDSQALPAIERDILLQVQLQDIKRGVQVAKSRNLLGRSQGNQRLEVRVQNFLALVSNGTTLQSAASQADVSMALVSKLAELGATKVLTPATETPAIPMPNRVPVINSNTERQSPTSTHFATESQPSSPSLSDATVAPSLKKQPEQPPDSVTSPPRSVPRKQTAIASRSQQPPSPLKKNVASSILASRPERASTAAPRSLAQAPKWLQAIDDANAAAFGLIVAKHRGQINPNTLTWKKAQGAIRQMRLGKSRETAASLANIPVNVLTQLIEWGQNRP